MKSKLQHKMQELGLDHIIVSGTRNSNPVLNYLLPPMHMFHITLVLHAQDNHTIVFNDMEIAAARQTGFRMLNIKELYERGYRPGKEKKSDSLLSYYRALISALKLKGTVGFCVVGDTSLYYNLFPRLQQEVSTCRFDFSELSALFNSLRKNKNVEEIAKIKRAGHKCRQVFHAFESFVSQCGLSQGIVIDQRGEPVTIGQVRQLVETKALEVGLLAGNDTILAQGRDAGIPHHTGTDEQPLEAGRTIVFDFFPLDRETGYYFDMTRSYCPGFAEPAIEEAYDLLKKVQDETIALVQPGQPLSLLQERACDLIEAAGYPTIRSISGTSQGYTHGLGHGIGVEVHEAPSISSHSSHEIEPGMVFTIEPGLYFPEKGWGLRLEDIVAVTSDGKCENLTDFPRNLVIPLKQT